MLLPTTKLETLTLAEEIIATILDHHGSVFGLDIVRISNLKLSRGTVYTALARMQANGLITVELEENVERGIPRNYCSLTENGSKALKLIQKLRSCLEEHKA